MDLDKVEEPCDLVKAVIQHQDNIVRGKAKFKPTPPTQSVVAVETQGT